MIRYFLVFFLFLISVGLYSQDTTASALVKEEEPPMVVPRGYFRFAMASALEGVEQGQRLGIVGMGSLGGRHEEADWLELGASFDLTRIMKWDSETKVRLHTLFSMFPNQGTYIHLNTGVGIQELYVTADDKIGDLPIQLWAGLRYYRTDNIEASDYFNFNNLSGPTAGIKINNTQLAVVIDAPFQNNPGSPYGTTVDAFRERVMLVLQHTQPFGKHHKVDFLTEYHRAGWEVDVDSTAQVLSEGVDWGMVFGLRHHWQLTDKMVNRASARYGTRLANGPADDNWSSRTFITVGNPNVNNNFDGGYAWHLTNNFQFSASTLLNFEAYAVYRQGKGADNAIDYNNKANYKEDFTIGSRVTWFLSNKIHFITEGSYQTKVYKEYTSRREAVSEAGTAQVTHLAFGPMYVPNGKRNMFARPVFRLIYAFSFYNNYAQQEQLSDYLRNVDNSSMGHYLGLKTEFWF